MTWLFNINNDSAKFISLLLFLRDCTSKLKRENAYRFAVCFICKEEGHLAKVWWLDDCMETSGLNLFKILGLSRQPEGALSKRGRLRLLWKRGTSEKGLPTQGGEWFFSLFPFLLTSNLSKWRWSFFSVFSYFFWLSSFQGGEGHSPGGEGGNHRQRLGRGAHDRSWQVQEED